MTKTRISPDRELYGILGSHPDVSRLQSTWNAYFAKNAMDAFMDKYPTTVTTMHERLSEMFHFDRRAYIVGPTLQEAIIPFLDTCSEARVNCVVNTRGVFRGYLIDDPFEIEDVLATILS
jgi:shikimate 5-dehydrogenase